MVFVCVRVHMCVFVYVCISYFPRLSQPVVVVWSLFELIFLFCAYPFLLQEFNKLIRCNDFSFDSHSSVAPCAFWLCFDFKYTTKVISEILLYEGTCPYLVSSSVTGDVIGYSLW